MPLELREARYFVAVAEELSFRRAAERLHMSQPPLSQVVKALEQRLGVQLLRRSTREVTLTAAGQVFLDRCRELLSSAEAAEDAARAAAGGAVGRLRLAAVTSAFVHPLPGALERFARDYPLVELRVRETDTHVAVEDLRRGDLDIAFVRQLGVPRGLHRLTLHTERFALALPAFWEGSGRPVRRLLDAADLPWVWVPREVAPDYHDQVVACCRAAGFAPDARHTTSSIFSQLAMVGCGLGVALVPAAVAQQTGLPSASVRLLPLDDSPTIDLAAVWRQDGSPLVEALLASVAAVGAQAPPPARTPPSPDAVGRPPGPAQGPLGRRR